MAMLDADATDFWEDESAGHGHQAEHQGSLCPAGIERISVERLECNPKSVVTSSQILREGMRVRVGLFRLESSDPEECRQYDDDGWPLFSRTWESYEATVVWVNPRVHPGLGMIYLKKDDGNPGIVHQEDVLEILSNE